MDMLALIIALSAVMWYIIDRVKNQFWEGTTYGKYITICIAAVFGFALSFSFNLDIIYACGLFSDSTLAGKILTGLLLMSGSSAISEIIEKIKS